MQRLKSGSGSLSRISEDEEHDGNEEAAVHAKDKGSLDPEQKLDPDPERDGEGKEDEIPWWLQPFYLQLFSVAGIVALFVSIAVGFHVTLQIKSGQCALFTSDGSRGLETARVYSKGTWVLGLSGASGISVFDANKQGGVLGNRKYEFSGNLSMGTCQTFSCDASYREKYQKYRVVHGYIRLFSTCPALLYEQAAAPVDNFSHAFIDIVLRELQRVGEATPPRDFDPGNRNLELQMITGLLASNSMSKINALAERLALTVAGTDIKLEQLKSW